MPYTDAWNVTDPPGTEQAKNIDNHIRKLRLQLEERLEDVLVVDMTADPVILKDEAKGAVVGKSILIPAAHAAVDTGASADYGTGGEYLSTQAQIHVPIILPLGVTITLVELLGDKMANASFSWELRSRPFSGAAQSLITTVVHSSIGISITDSGVLALVTDNVTLYWVNIVASAAARRFYALRVTYDTPDSRNTI